jgi:hypothetical protein
MPDYQVVVNIDLSVFVSRMQCSAKLLRSGALLIRAATDRNGPGSAAHHFAIAREDGRERLKARAAPRPGHVLYFIGCGVKSGQDGPTI